MFAVVVFGLIVVMIWLSFEVRQSRANEQFLNNKLKAK